MLTYTNCADPDRRDVRVDYEQIGHIQNGKFHLKAITLMGKVVEITFSQDDLSSIQYNMESSHR